MDKNDKYSEKLKKLNQRIAENPNDAILFRERAELNLENGKLLECVKDIDKAIELDPQNADNYLFRGDINWDFLKSIKDDPKFQIQKKLLNFIISDYKKASKLISDNKNNKDYEQKENKIIDIVLRYIELNDYENAYEDFMKIGYYYDYDEETTRKILKIADYFEEKEEYNKEFDIITNIDPDDYNQASDGFYLEKLKYINEKMLEKQRNEIDTIKIKRNYEKSKHEEEKRKIKTRIFQAMSHTIGSFVWSDKLIINKIREGRSSENDIRRLELFNELILSIMNSIKIAYSSNKVIDNTLDKDIKCSKSVNNISVYHLFCFCLNINLERLIRGSEGWGSTRKSFFFLDKKDKTNYWKSIDYFESIQNSPNFLISDLSEDAITTFIKFFKSNVLQKINRYFDIQINELKNLYVIKNSYTFSVLFVIFLELTKNMFRYGSIKDKVKRIFKIYAISDKEYFHINFINFVNKSSYIVKESTLQGLEMVQEFSKVLGEFQKTEKPIKNSNFSEFSIKLSIRRKRRKK